VEEELVIITIMIKTSLLRGGETYGHCRTVVNQDSYCTVTGLNTFVYNHPVNPGAYPTGITMATMDALCHTTEAKHKIKP
jgi:hypothetical protein